MAVWNIRGVPEDLARSVKAVAATQGKTLTDFVIDTMKQEVGHASKKIADITVVGGATGGGGDPCLPRGGKAQDRPRFDNPMDMPGSRVVIPEACDTTLTRRANISFCRGCETYGGNLGPCETWIEGPNGRCPYCDHKLECHIAAGSVATRTPFVWSASELKKIAEEGPGGFSTLDSETLTVLKKRAEVDAETAKILYLAGVELDREILVRWGLAENYKPKTEEKGDAEIRGAKGRRAAGQDRGSVGGDSKTNPEGNDVAEGGTVATGKPGVNMQALRDICEGKLTPAPAANRNYNGEWMNPIIPDPGEVDLCGFKAHNEEDGEWYVCTKEKHGTKVKHGEWIKV